jgi:hypothetical protein
MNTYDPICPADAFGKDFILSIEDTTRTQCPPKEKEGTS